MVGNIVFVISLRLPRGVLEAPSIAPVTMESLVKPVMFYAFTREKLIEFFMDSSYLSLDTGLNLRVLLIPALLPILLVDFLAVSTFLLMSISMGRPASIPKLLYLLVMRYSSWLMFSTGTLYFLLANLPALAKPLLVLAAILVIRLALRAAGSTDLLDWRGLSRGGNCLPWPSLCLTVREP